MLTAETTQEEHAINYPKANFCVSLWGDSRRGYLVCDRIWKFETFTEAFNYVCDNLGTWDKAFVRLAITQRLDYGSYVELYQRNAQ